MKNLLLIFTILFSCLTNSQEKVRNNSLVNIHKTITNYYQGYIYRDINKLNKAFDTVNGTMKVPVIENEKIIGFKNVYFKDLMPIWGNREKLNPKVLENCSLEILTIDIVDNKIASAKISMKVDKTTYIDILSLQKINDDWKITNKIYVSKE